MKNYNRKVEHICEVCDTTFLAWRGSKTKTCSKACQSEMAKQKLIALYSEKAGEPIGQYLWREYVDNLRTYRQIMDDLGLTQVHTLKKLFRMFGVPIRHGSEAVKVQWINNVERRERARQIIRQNDLPAKSGEPNPAQQPGVGEKISQAKAGHPMYNRPSWYRNVTRSIQRREREKEPNSLELIMLGILEEAGINYEWQKPIGPYSVDFAIEIEAGDIRLAIECDGAYWHAIRRESDKKRDALLSSAGWTVMRFDEKQLENNPDKCKRLILKAMGI